MHAPFGWGVSTSLSADSAAFLAAAAVDSGRSPELENARGLRNPSQSRDSRTSTLSPALDAVVGMGTI
eukprot:5806770-Pyramimonas_sp.AAC.1